jgi:hypothetical protein
VALEAGAREVREFSLTAVPGLLQTADYARALFESAAIPLSEEERERQVEVRMIRQKRLYSEDDPLKLLALVDESVLRRPIGGAKVLRGQLEHLVMVAEADTVVLRDTKDRTRAPHHYPAREWATFLAAVRTGEFD